MIQAKTVNLQELKDEVGKICQQYQTKAEGHYRRLTRFFTSQAPTQLWFQVLKYGFYLLNDHCNERKMFYLDATEWKIGKFNFHLLLLAFHYKNVAIPIYFKSYNHKGVLSEEERIEFIKVADEFLSLSDAILMADREFIGDKWFACLRHLSIKFIIRIRKNQYQNALVDNRSILICNALKIGQDSCLIKINDTDHRLWVISNKSRTTTDPLIYLLTNILDSEYAIEEKNVPSLYRMRWKIECLFKHLKTNGYNIEDLRMTDLNKI